MKAWVYPSTAGWHQIGIGSKRHNYLGLSSHFNAAQFGFFKTLR
jgi:hypothetical protein